MSITNLAFSPEANSIYESVQSSNSNQGTVESNQPATPAAGSSRQPPDFSNKTLIYPEKLLRNQSDFFQIKAIEYTPPNQGGQSSQPGLNSFYQSRTQQNLRSERSKGMVIFPMPAKVTDVNGTNWGEGFLNPAGAAAVGAYSAASGIAGGLISGELESGFKSAGGLLSGIKETLTDAGAYSYGSAYATTQAINQFGINLNPDELLARTQGTISNPNGELLFKGPRLRGYSFVYRMVPRNRNEARTIRQIVRFFKQSMLPPKSGILLNTPHVFFLEYKRKSNGVVKALNKFKPCALTDFNVDNSAGEGWNSYYDETEDISQPIATTIQLNFTELTPIFREDYAEFSNVDDVGY